MESPFKSKNGLERIAKAAGYSIAGLKSAYKNEAAIRQETWLMVVLIPLGLQKALDPLDAPVNPFGIFFGPSNILSQILHITIKPRNLFLDQKDFPDA